MTREIIEIDTEKINATHIKSKVNPEKEMTLNLAISENAEEKCSQQSIELVVTLRAIINTEKRLLSSKLSLKSLQFNTPSCSDASYKKKKEKT